MLYLQIIENSTVVKAFVLVISGRVFVFGLAFILPLGGRFSKSAFLVRG
jgi:hypothetical protein